MCEADEAELVKKPLSHTHAVKSALETAWASEQGVQALLRVPLAEYVRAAQLTKLPVRSTTVDAQSFRE